MAATLLFFVILVVAVILLALLLALYLVPVTVETVADCRQEGARATATVAWGIAAARVRVADGVQVLDILLAGRRVMTRDLREMAAPEPEEEKKKKVEEPKPALPLREYLDAAGDLWPHLQRILAAFVRSLCLETLRGDVTLGLESPADTGVVYGYCTAVRYALWPAEAIDFVMTPVFDREVFEGTFTLKMQIRRPLLILIPVVRALLQKQVRQRLRQVPGRGAPGA
ncbi:DUF2953 domain-containing protein [Methanoculleus sp. YWC-01]|jgi:hypothetical protein|uniref:DUF2953 domain-containing protein n=1 Tax=Methanoculleus nereidis TaxID=2735141 RepID=A0ABU3YZP8_9EURY|nr:DUF2953 domain-containing protein [Methanoculleus sp. YWC-01]MCK9298243.1 DUF2953 domain-containing protein [Methanoculleus sp.]MDV4341874.1 DUF2953 domain-containing protein [Methanoculleus sp. YWC-01]PKL55700.1 MAG: hypothetical protein CVV35_08560 [Methanomicrobiales archaeon HGW-Methanomicrobiales-6]